MPFVAVCVCSNGSRPGLLCCRVPSDLDDETRNYSDAIRQAEQCVGGSCLLTVQLVC